MPLIKRKLSDELIIFENAMFWTDRSEILYCKFNNEDSESKLNYRRVNLYIKAIVKLCNGRPMPFLIDVRDTKGTFSITAAKLLTNNPELLKLRISESFITNTIGMRLLITAYKRIYNPITPYGVFSELEAAKDYCFETKNNFYASN
jgi:hypothetical protein